MQAYYTQTVHGDGGIIKNDTMQCKTNLFNTEINESLPEALTTKHVCIIILLMQGTGMCIADKAYSHT